MILLAGGDGFIGSNLQRLLQNHGIAYDVVDLKSGTDICDVDGSKYEVIVLLAANLNHDEVMVAHNKRIYDWAERQTAHIIYTSSAAVYGDSAVAHTENDETLAPTLYGESKLAGEKTIKSSVSSYTILRLANVYGEGDGNGAIDIFKRGGNKIYGDGSDVRDYVHVGVVAEAIKRVALNPSLYDGEVFNISSNKPLTTKQAFALFSNTPHIPDHVPARGFDVKYSVLNNAKAIAAGLIDEN